MYIAFKFIHLLGVVLFLGNIIVTAVWKALADQTAEPRTIAYAQRLVTITDWIFTLGGIILVLIGGYGMVAFAGLDPLGPTWLLWGQVLFIASAVIWVLFLIPTQIAQARMARAFAQGGPIPDSYWRRVDVGPSGEPSPTCSPWPPFILWSSNPEPPERR